MKRFFLTLVFLLACSGCGSAQPTSSLETPLVTSTVSMPLVQPVVIKLEPGSYRAQIEYASSSQFVSQWASTIDTSQIVINGAYFHEDYSPSGFLVVDGKRVGERMFDQDKSGLIAIDTDGLEIRDLTTTPILPEESFDFALQSYPFLIKNGQPSIQTDSGLKARRTAIGIDDTQNVYVVALTADEISLYEFMNKLVETGIPFVHVLNLDGGPSTGIIADWGEHQLSFNSFTPVSSVVRFVKK